MIWQTKKLGEICDFYNGLWKGKKPPYIEVGVIRNTNFTKDGELDGSDIAYLPVEKKQLEKRKLVFGDIILEKSGGGPKQPVGRVIVFNKKEGIFSFSNFTSAIRIKDQDEVDYNYLHKFLFFSYISGITESMQSHSTGIRNLDIHVYKEIEIFIPPLLEQKRIVKILDEVFNKIEKAKENAEKNLKNSKELFESYLQNVFANPGKDWEEKILGEVCNFYNGKAHEKAIDANGAYIVVNSKFISSNGEKYKKTKKALFPLVKDDIVMVMSDVPNGKALAKCFIVDKNDTYSLNQRICALRSKVFQTRFLYLQLNRNKYLLDFNNGENQTNLRKDDILNCPLYIPPISTQKSIISKLDTLSEQTKRLREIYRQKLADLEELKKSVLNKAFSGEL